jgi:hypothetical protein
MAHFFLKAAKDSIQVARVKGMSTTNPGWLDQLFSENSNCGAAYQKEFISRWDTVCAAWNTISIDGQHDAGLGHLLVALEERRTADAQAQAVRLEAATRAKQKAEQDRLAKQKAAEEQRVADSADRAAQVDAKRAANQHDFQLRQSLRAFQSTEGVDLYDWCESHPLADGSTFFDDGTYGKEMARRAAQPNPVQEEKENDAQGSSSKVS